MALDPLRFAIEIADEASSKLTSIKTLIDGLNNKEITVNVQGNLREVLDILSKSGTDANALSGLQNALSGALSALEGLGNAARNGDLGTFSTEVGKATEAVNGLATAFEKMNVAVGNNESFKSFMTGVGELVSRTNSAMKQLNSVGGNEGGNDSADKGFLRLSTSVEKARYELYQFDNLIKSAESASRLGKQFSDVDTNGLDKAIEKAKTFRAELEQISQTGKGKDDRRFDKFALQADYKEAVAEVRRLVGETETLETSQRRYNTILQGTKDLMQRISNAQDSAQNIGAQNNLIGKFSEAYDFKQRLQSLSDSDKANAHIISELAAEYTRLAQALTRATKEQEKLNAATEKEKKRSDDDRAREIQRVATNQRRLNGAYEEAGRLIARLEAAGMKGLSLNLDVAKVDEARNQLVKFQEDLVQFGKAYAHNNHTTQETIGNFNILRRALVETAKAQEQMNTATEKANKEAQRAAQRQQEQAAKQAAEATKRAQQENEAWANSMKTATNEANKLDVKIRELQRTESGAAPGVNTSQLRSYINDLRVYRDILKDIAAGSRAWGQAGTVIGNNKPFTGIDTLNNTKRLADEAANAVNRETREIERNQAEKQKAAGSTSQLTAEEQRLAQALNQTTEHARGQSQVLSDLKSMAMQYLGVWGGQQFLRNIIEIGGQLEMQRLSIGAILQNQSQANDLFERIKGLAVQSPFGVVELDQMTKQLTAYGFKYNELFDMTKRLADISAATGTGVDRLALALGHVRSEAALSGYTLRQFSMANVPLLQKLSEKLGKTTQEIRKMVRAKEVSYEDVIGVLKDITNEGGMFYNMQEVISQSVKAKFKNVKDAMDIMYGEMAEGYIGDSLKGVAEALMEVTRNWKDAATVLGTGAALWAAQRVAVMAYTSTIGQNNAAVLSSIAAHRQKEAAMLRDASTYRSLSVAELRQLATMKNLTVWEKIRIKLGGQLSLARQRSLALARDQQVRNLTLALSEKKLTTEAILRQVAYGKLLKWQAYQIISNAELAASERTAALAALDHTVKLKGVSLAAEMVGNSVRKAALAIKGFALNPAMLGMAAVTALIELWQSHNSQMEKAEEIGQNIYQHSQDAIKASQTMLKEYSASLVLTNGQGMQLDNAQFSDLGIKNIKNARIQLPEFDTEIAEQAIEQWSTYIRDYAYNSAQILNNALYDNEGNVRSLADQFNNLRDAVSNVVLAQYGLQDLGGSFENAIKATNSDWEIDDDVITNIKDYTNTMRKANSEISKLYSGKFREGIDKGIAFAQEHSKAFAEATKDVQTYGEAFDVLLKRYDEFPDAARMVNDFSGLDIGGNMNIMDRVDELRRDKEAMDNDLQTFYITLKADLERQGLDLQNLSENQQQALLLGYKKQLEEAGNLSEGLMKELMLAFAQEFHIPLIIDDEKFMPKLDEAKRLLKELTGEDWKVDLRFATNITNVIDEARKQYKAAKEFYANAEPVMLKFGIKFKLGDALSEDQIKALVAKAPAESKEFLEQLLKGANEASKLFNQATSASKAGGFSLEDPNKKSKSKNKSKSGSKKAYKDEEVEKWKERMRNIREAYREYEKWEKKVGEAEALSRIKREFSGLIDENTLNDIKNYRKEIEKIRNDAQVRYNSQRKDKSKDYGKQAQQLVRDSEKALNEIDLGVFDRAAEKFKSDMERTLSDLTRKWELFTSVRNATGNTEAASVLAGFGNDIPEAKDVAGAFKEYLQAEIAKMGDEVKIPIRFDKSMSKKEVEDMVKGALGGTKYKEQIDAITDGIQRWIELSKDAEKKAVDAYTAAMTKAMDYVSQVQRINTELAEQNRLIDENNNLSQEQKDRAKGINQANASMKIIEASDSYKRFFNNVFGETQTELQGMANTIKAQLNYSLEKGAITAEDYAKRIKDIDNVMQQSEISDPDKWYNKGIFNTETMDQRFQRQRDQGNEKIQQGADMLQQGLNSGDGKLIADGQKIKEAGQNMVNGANKAALAMAIIDKVVHGIDQTIQGTAKAFDYLKEALDALGVESDTMSSLGDYLHTLGEMSSHVSSSWDNFKNGNFVGAGVEAIGAVTSVIKGISQAHDNRLERAIERLRDDVKSIEANTELIVRSRERTLGYDMGDVRRAMIQQYSPQSWRNQDGTIDLTRLLNGGFNSKQQRSMFEYYSQNSFSTGYQQEYNNLLEQREKYLEILKDQQDKKKKSNEEIEETKSKIAELDDQIAYFSQDLAKELWGIDIKGWADQLSDALASAFENGENMAKAYRETVTSIIQQMMQKMMQMAILEPMFERLQKQLFGENGKGGVFDPNNPKGSMSKVTKIIGDYFGKGGEGEKAITASMEFMTAFQRGMQNVGLTVLNEASNTLSSGIQGTSEETSDLLAGYVNALRQDVSVNRILLTQYVTQLWPQYIEAYTAQVTSVSNIDNNVRVIMEMMQLGNGAMYEQIAAMRSRIDNIVMGVDRVSIR